MGLRDRTLFASEQCFFVTTTCHEHKHVLCTEEALMIVAGSLNFCAEKYKAEILGYVIMPNHLHLIIYFREDNHLSDLMRDFKKFTSVKIRHEIENSGKQKLLEDLRYQHREQKFKVWSDRFDDVVLRTRQIAAIKLEYIHNNPLQEHWQLVPHPADYRFSSASFYEGVLENPVRLTHLLQYF